MENKTTEVQNYENMSLRDARNYIKENAKKQKKILTIAGDNRKYIIDALREKNHNDPKLQQAKKINVETSEIIRNYVATKLNKKVEELTLEEWQQAVRDFYEENDAVDSEWAAEDNSEEKEKKSRELPAWLPAYAYEIDKYFKNETWDDRNPEMMKKIDEVVLKMREDWILKTESKDWWVYTTVKLPRKKPIHFLEPDLSKYSGYSWNVLFWWKEVDKNVVTLRRMRWDVGEWKNKELKRYVKNSWLYLPKKDTIRKFMQKLSNFVSKKYQLNIWNDRDRIDLFCRAMNSVWSFWLADYEGDSRSYFRCSNLFGGFLSASCDDEEASFFLTDYKG